MNSTVVPAGFATVLDKTWAASRPASAPKYGAADPMKSKCLTTTAANADTQDVEE